MKKFRNLTLGSIAACSIIMSGCSNDTNKSNLSDGEEYVYSESISNAPVYGFVKDTYGKALSHVLVTSGQDTTLTSENGSYSLEKCHAVNGRSIIKFENNDYFTVIRTAEIKDEGTQVDAVLMPQDINEGVTDLTKFKNSQGATITVGKMTISIPANSLVYENDGREFNGSVFASTYYLNPNSENFAKEMPGGDMSGVTADGKDVILLSYGMVEVTLKDSANQKLQLKPGAESTLSFPIPDGYSESQKHNEIPLWYFDEGKGTWIEEGIATKRGDSYSGKVKHFSWHNLDYPELRANICGRVTNTNGQPVAGVLVTISQTNARTDSAGYYCAFVPRYTPVFVTVKPTDYANYTNCPIYHVDGMEAGSTFTQDIVLPSFPCIHGKVTDLNDTPLYGISVFSNSETTITDFRGNYYIYYNGNDAVSLHVAGYINKEYKKYEFKDPSEIDENTSYDFKIDKPRRIFGYIITKNGFVDDAAISPTVTIVVDQKEYSIPSKTWSYEITLPQNISEITAYIKAKDGYGVESNRVKSQINKWRTWLPYIYLPTGIEVKGSITNSCGPSKATITLEAGRGKKKQTFTQTSKFGYFRFNLPINITGDAKVKINCQGKKLSKKIELDTETIDLGDFEFCSGEKPDPNCIYAIIGDKTIKFDTQKDKTTEMFLKNGIQSKYQIWYKNADFDGTLVVELKYPSNYGGNSSVYLIQNEGIASKQWYSKVSKDSIYTIQTDCELFNDRSGNVEDIYLYGSADIVWKSIYDNIDKEYLDYINSGNGQKTLVGKANGTKFYTFKVSQENTKQLENHLKSNNYKEVKTFMDDEQRITTIYLKEDSEALIHRNKDNTSEMTILSRKGIGTEPLYHCWKVDFRDSPLKEKSGNVDYMWKDEADIAQLVMFGPIMGVKFTKTNINEQRCGCTTSAPAVAN